MFFLLRLTQRVVLTNQTPESGEGALLLLWEQRSQTAPLCTPSSIWHTASCDCKCVRSLDSPPSKPQPTSSCLLPEKQWWLV